MKINRQSKIANQEIEVHLYIFINYQQNNCSKKLVMAKFAANNNKLASTKLSPFFAIKALHPYTSFNKVELSNASTCKRIFNQKALDISRKI